MTSDYYDFNSETGAITAKDTSVIKAAVQSDLTEALGASVFSPSTPMGRLVEWLTMFGANVLKVNMQNSNQLLISSAAGQQLDALALLFGLQRKAATKTTVTATLTGTAATVIASGSRAKTEDGDVFELTADVTLDSLGTSTGVFAAVEYGAVKCNSETLAYIDTPIIGWDGVINDVDGVLGDEVETDDELRIRIQESRYSGIGFMGAIKNAIEAVDGVKSSMVVENNTSSAMTVHGVDNVWAHSIFACVDCSDSPTVERNVAYAIYNNKPCGTSYTRLSVKTNESKNGTITDVYGNSYQVYFYKPEKHLVSVYLKVLNRSYVGVDVEADVKYAIKHMWDKADNYKVGETVYASDITRAVESLLPGILVLRCIVNYSGVTPGIYENAAYEEVAASAKAVFYTTSGTTESDSITVEVGV